LPFVGFSISDTSLRFVSLTKHEHTFVLGDYAEHPFKEGVVDAGFINQPEEIVAILKELKKKYSLQFIKITLPEEKAFVFRTQIPAVSPEEIRGSVEFTIEENAPLSVSEVVFDYMVVPTKNSSEDGKIDVVVSVVPQKVVDSYLKLCSEAGLFVVSCELESQAIARCIVRKDDISSYLILNLERNKTGFYITTGGAVQFTSTMVITPNNLSGLCDEISKIYWHTHGDKKGNVKISKILLSGEHAGHEGVREYIVSNLGIDVEVANVWENVFTLDTYVPDLSYKDSLSFAPAIGLALPFVSSQLS